MTNSLAEIGIAGAGLMGCSIAAAFLRVRIPVLLYDFAEGARLAAPERITEELACQLARGSEPAADDRRESRHRTAELLTVAADPSDLDRTGTVLETIVEKSKVKQKFYKTLDRVFTSPKLLLTNTSTIQIGELASGLAGTRFLTPECFCGFHFFHPVRKRSLVEVIRGPLTEKTTLREAEELARRIEKEPILVEDGPGFLVNRVLNPYLEEAMTLLLEGVPLDRIEEVCRAFGMEMGPFRIMDEIGLDVTFHSGWTFYKAFPQYIQSGELLPAMIESGRLGRKNGLGFKRYELRGNWSDEGAADPALDQLVRKIGGNPPKKIFSGSDSVLGSGVLLNGSEISDEILALRVFCAILAEGIRATQDGIVTRPSEVDRALTRALGFPYEKGGIFPWAKSVGKERITQICSEFEKLNPKYKLSGLF